ncbi:hypothetical protein LSH36_1120g01059 [Paralvinella palmiformis]|uniref:non-specific serine/threonine protein kinase n=1 Tax=Paralvinella palmiformis TaxID=53620 RepID=A0AAD9IUV7_9ANNE|nr:hypothetical protein LSH36_1120g01059 [Paralvinella palmiformis]
MDYTSWIMYSRAYNGFHPGRTLRHSFPFRKQYGTFGNRAGIGSYWNGPTYNVDTTLNKPKVITVIRNGPERPRANVNILLNRRSVQSFEQLMRDIAEAFGPKWRNNKVRKLFNIKGREVQGISDFFRDDEVFIGVGNDSLTTGDVQEILDDLYPESPYAKNLLKEWEKTKKRYQNLYHNKTKEDEPKQDDSKIDSGLGSDADNGEDVIYRGRGHDVYKFGKKKQKQQQPQQQHEADQQFKVDQDQLRMSEDERERARKRMQKRLDTERRIMEEERRKKGLVPLKAGQESVRKRESPERKPPDSGRDPSPNELPKIRRKKNRLTRRDSDEPKVIIVIKGEDAIDSSRSPSRKIESHNEDGQNMVQKPNEEKRDSEQKDKRKLLVDDVNVENSRRKQKADDDQKKSIQKENIADEQKKRKTKKKVADVDNKQLGKENETLDTDKDNDIKDPLKDKKKRTKAKTIIYKNKIERQISDISHVMVKYIPGKTLGDGNFAVVKQCKLVNTNVEYAMKIVDKAKLKGKEHMIENEIEIMKLCNHPNIARLVEEYETEKEIYLIMELVKGGDLFDAITQSVKFSEDHSSHMVSDLAQALFYLHSRGIVHRDLKPENLLVQRNKDSSITLKLADFGLAMEVRESIYTVCGTPTYVAPEILAETGYGLEVDMWAIGVITYILLCGFPPFRSPDRKQTELFEFIKAGEYEFLSPYWDNISRSAKDLIKHLLVVDKRKRYTAIDVICHPWIITFAGTLGIEDMETYRKNLRVDLETQAKLNHDNYMREHHKQG